MKLYYIENIKVNNAITDSKMRKSINLNLILNEVQEYDKLYSVVNQAYNLYRNEDFKLYNFIVCTLYTMYIVYVQFTLYKEQYIVYTVQVI